MIFQQKICILSQVFTMEKLELFADLKKMVAGKIFGSNEEAIAETNAYFEVKEKSIPKKSWRSDDCIALEVEYVYRKNSVFFLFDW